MNFPVWNARSMESEAMSWIELVEMHLFSAAILSFSLLCSFCMCCMLLCCRYIEDETMSLDCFDDPYENYFGSCVPKKSDSEDLPPPYVDVVTNASIPRACQMKATLLYVHVQSEYSMSIRRIKRSLSFASPVPRGNDPCKKICLH